MDEYCDRLADIVTNNTNPCRMHYENTLSYCIDYIKMTRLPKSFWKQSRAARSQQEMLLPIKHNLTECFNLVIGSASAYNDIIDLHHFLAFWNGIYIRVLIFIAIVLSILFFMVVVYPRYRIMYDLDTGKLVVLRKYKDNEPPSKPLTTADVFDARMKRLVAIMKYEVTRLHIDHILTPEELVTPDGSAVLVLRTSNIVDTLCGVVNGRYQTKGRFYRTVQPSQRQQDLYKIETISRAMRFLNGYDRKLHIVLLFDDEPMRQLQDQQLPGITHLSDSSMMTDRKSMMLELQNNSTGIRRFSYEHTTDTENEIIERTHELIRKGLPKSKSLTMSPSSRESRGDGLYRSPRRNSSLSVSQTRCFRSSSKSK